MLSFSLWGGGVIKIKGKGREQVLDGIAVSTNGKHVSNMTLINPFI